MKRKPKPSGPTLIERIKAEIKQSNTCFDALARKRIGRQSKLLAEALRELAA
jgi:hypothetical protein